jgi:hypothetical protein
MVENQALTVCPQCDSSLSAPLKSGRIVCRECGWTDKPKEVETVISCSSSAGDVEDKNLVKRELKSMKLSNLIFSSVAGLTILGAGIFLGRSMNKASTVTTQEKTDTIELEGTDNRPLEQPQGRQKVRQHYTNHTLAQRELGDANRETPFNRDPSCTLDFIESIDKAKKSFGTSSPEDERVAFELTTATVSIYSRPECGGVQFSDYLMKYINPTQHIWLNPPSPSN